jgi:hypothetical protein
MQKEDSLLINSANNLLNFAYHPELKAKEKIKALFEYRHIAENISFAGFNGTQRQDILNALFLMQMTIYSLDEYGEQTWRIKDADLTILWRKIYKSLDYWGITPAESYLLVSDMNLYQRVEINLRRGILPTILPIDRFYYLKTCDVRLSRKLIAKRAPDRRKEELLFPLWCSYDLVGEVYDDLTDVSEDTITFNCNRFLFQYETQGRLKTQEEYQLFISKLNQQMKNLVIKRNNIEEAQLIHEWFLIAVQKVHDLLLQ